MKKLFLVFSVTVSSFGFGQTLIANSDHIRISDSIRKSEINWNLVYEEFYILLNDYRKNHGLNSLVFDSTISNVAEFQSEYMFDTKTVTHETDILGYTTLADRLIKFECLVSYAGENCLNSSFLLVVASNQSIAEHILQRWVASVGHNKLLLMPNVSHMALSISRKNMSGSFYSCLIITK